MIFSYAPAGKTLAEAGVPITPQGRAFRVPVDARGTPNEPGSIRAGFAVTNTADDVFNTVTLEVTHHDGTPAAPPAVITLPPSGQTARMLDELMTLPADFSGLLRVSAAFDVSVIALRFRINALGELKATTTTPSNEAEDAISEDRFFAHLADSEGWTTEFILYSGTAGQAASGTLSFFDTAGQPLDLAGPPVSMPPPPAGFAPADQAAFDSVFVGKQIVQDAFNYRLVFIGPGRVREIDGGESSEGNSGYVRTGPDTGTLTYTYDATGNDPALERSEMRMTFTSPTTGSFVYTYTESGSAPLRLDGSFELVDADSAGSCTNDLGTITGTVSRSGSWDGSCPSAHYPNGEYARYYTFTLGQQARVTIDLTSPSVDTWLALRNGAGMGTGLIESDNDGGSGANARIARTLAAGTYTIEATTLRGGVTGPFTLTVDVSTGGTQAPDLIVERASVDDGSPDAGASFTLSATVRNRGGGQSPATTLGYYRSANATISSSDTQVGTDGVAGLAAGASSAESIDLTAPSQAGTYYYGACVDSVTGESDTGNNCSSGVRVTVSDSGGGGSDDFTPLTSFTIGNDGTVTLRMGILTNVAGPGRCVTVGAITVNGQRYEIHWTAWQRNTGSGWTEIAGTRKTGQVCGYDLSSAGSGRYRAVGDLTIAGTRGRYRSANEVSK